MTQKFKQTIKKTHKISITKVHLLAYRAGDRRDEHRVHQIRLVSQAREDPSRAAPEDAP